MPKRRESDAHRPARPIHAPGSNAALVVLLGTDRIGRHGLLSAGQDRAGARPHGSRGELACSTWGLLAGASQDSWPRHAGPRQLGQSNREQSAFPISKTLFTAYMWCFTLRSYGATPQHMLSIRSMGTPITNPQPFAPRSLDQMIAARAFMVGPYPPRAAFLRRKPENKAQIRKSLGYLPAIS